MSSQASREHIDAISSVLDLIVFDNEPQQLAASSEPLQASSAQAPSAPLRTQPLELSSASSASAPLQTQLVELSSASSAMAFLQMKPCVKLELESPVPVIFSSPADDGWGSWPDLEFESDMDIDAAAGDAFSDASLLAEAFEATPHSAACRGVSAFAKKSKAKKIAMAKARCTVAPTKSPATKSPAKTSPATKSPVQKSQAAKSPATKSPAKPAKLSLAQPAKLSLAQPAKQSLAQPAKQDSPGPKMTIKCVHSRAYHKARLHAQKILGQSDQDARAYAKKAAHEAVAEFKANVQR